MILAKTCIEDTLTIATGDVLVHREGYYTGRVEWRYVGYTYTVRYAVDWDDLSVTLRFADSDGVNAVKQHLRLVSSLTRHDGRRWWFTCPFCSRRRGSLHLRGDQELFGCRECLDLTYRSSQQAHRIERTMARYLWPFGTGKP